jgi:hypothetical protein
MNTKMNQDNEISMLKNRVNYLESQLSHILNQLEYLTNKQRNSFGGFCESSSLFNDQYDKSVFGRQYYAKPSDPNLSFKLPSKFD